MAHAVQVGADDMTLDVRQTGFIRQTADREISPGGVVEPVLKCFRRASLADINVLLPKGLDRAGVVRNLKCDDIPSRLVFHPD